MHGLTVHNIECHLFSILLLNVTNNCTVSVCNLPSNFYTRVIAAKEKRKATMKALGTLSGAAKALQQKVRQQGKITNTTTSSTTKPTAATKFGIAKSSPPLPAHSNTTGAAAGENKSHLAAPGISATALPIGVAAPYDSRSLLLLYHHVISSIKRSPL